VVKPDPPSDSIDSSDQQPTDPSIDSSDQQPTDPSIDSSDQQPTDPSIDSSDQQPRTDPSTDSSDQQPTDPTSGEQPALFQLVAPAPPKPAPPSVPARMPTPQEARSSARLSRFKQTVNAEDNKEARTNKGWLGRRAKRVALVHQKRTNAHHESQEELEPLASHHEESQLESLASVHRRMEEDRIELEKGMAAVQQLSPPPVDSWDSGEENGEESDSIHTEDMRDCESSEEEE
jgi:hypothetical protein